MHGLHWNLPLSPPHHFKAHNQWFSVWVNSNFIWGRSINFILWIFLIKAETLLISSSQTVDHNFYDWFCTMDDSIACAQTLKLMPCIQLHCPMDLTHWDSLIESHWIPFLTIDFLLCWQEQWVSINSCVSFCLSCCTQKSNEHNFHACGWCKDVKSCVY